MTNDKQPRQTLKEMAYEVFLRGKAPGVNDLTVMTGRLIDGERDDVAVGLVANHGTPQMVLALHEVGAMTDKAWHTWKGRMTSADAELVLDSGDEWPHEVREWATVLAVSHL